MPLPAGSRIGVYEIRAPLGAGGMGEVYLAHDTRLDRGVAIKVLPAAFAGDADRLARLEREARTLAALNHPHIAQIYGLEEATVDGQSVRALVMELVDGETLADRIAGSIGGLPIQEALAIARPITEALAAAHEQGVVHRDLKPANIKVTAGDIVKVLDFGLAKAVDTVAASNLTFSPTLSVMATQAGMILGTAAYMSPEQARGKPIDKRTDVWAFGCVLFEMLTGRRAFEGEDATDTIAAIVRGEPDWRALPAELPAQIRLLLERCLTKDRTARLPDIAVARFLLTERVPFDQAAAVASSPAAVSSPLWTRALPVAITAVVVAALTGAAAWTWRGAAPAAPVTRFVVPLGEGQQFNDTGRTNVAISADGTQIVYLADRRLYLRAMSEVDAQPIEGSSFAAGIMQPVFSPDGRSIAFYSVADRTLRKIATTGGTAEVLATIDTGVPVGMTWSGDALLFGQEGSGIVRVSADGGAPSVLIPLDADEHAHGPQMLPDGETVLFTLATGTAEDRWEKAQIVAHSLASGERTVLIPAGGDARYVPTGHLLYAAGGVVFAVPFDVDRVAVTGGPRPVIEGVRRSVAAPAVAHFATSNTGSLVYFPGPRSATARQSRLTWINRDGAVEPLPLQAGPYTQPRVSSDGTRVAYVSDVGVETNVWVYAVAGTSAPRRLTFGGRNRAPVWSRDGQWVAFQSDRDGAAAIFRRRANGTGMEERLTQPKPGTTHTPMSWSSDGTTLLFDATTGAETSLWTLSVADRTSAPFGQIRSAGPTNATFSPDGRWIAYEVFTPPIPTIFVEPFPRTGTQYEIATGSIYPTWAHDGQGLFYLPRGQFMFVTIATEPAFAIGNPVSLPTGGLWAPGPLFVRTYDIARDGRVLGLITADDVDGSRRATPSLQVVMNWFEELKARVPAP